MKKLLMLLFLMTISLGQSQTFPLDFSDAADLIPGVDGVTTSIVQNNGDSVLQIVGSTGTWDNCQAILAQNLDLSDNANNTITFRFKSIGASTSGQHLLKFEGGTGGAAIAEGFFTASGTEWQTITIDFGAGLGKYSKIVIFTDSGAGSNGWSNNTSGTYLIDDIAGGTNVAPPVVAAPTDAATAPSARNAWDVVSIYTDGTYADKAATNFNPGWGQATVYSPFAVGGNNMLKYSNINYQGIAFATGINVSAMDTVHLDLWTADCTSFNFYLIGGGENSVTLTPTQSGWNSFDIPMSSYSARTLANIIQLKFTGNGTVYLDNIYFSRATTNKVPPTLGAFTVPAKLVGSTPFDLTAPTSDGSGAFTFSSSNTAVATISGSTVTIVAAGSSIITAIQAAAGGFGVGIATAELVVSFAPPAVAATAPTLDAADVISVFSGAYTDVAGTNFFPGWGQSTQYTPLNIDGNPTIKYSNLNYEGITFASPINGSAMEKLHIDIWTPNCASFQMFVLDGSDPEQSVTLTPSFNGWNSYDIDLAQYTSLTKSNLVEFKMVGSGILYLDNIYFWKLPAGTYSYYADNDSDGYGAGVAVLSTETSAPTGYSVNNTDCNDANDAIYPGATEIADTLDNDCDGTIDEGFPPTIAAPTPPARNAWDVKSLFSGAYENVTINELPTSWSQTAIAPFSVESIGGNDTWKFGGEFLGMEINSNPGVNLTDMTMMHIDYWTADPNLLILKIVNTVDGGDATTIVEDPTSTGSWRSRDIPMSTFGGSINKSKITQLLIDPQSGGSTVYVDNLYFYRPATSAPSPTIGALTVPAKVVGDASFDLTTPSSNSAGAFTFTSSNESVATISGTTVTIVGAGSAIITATQAAAGEYGAGSTEATLVVSLNVAATTPTIPADRVLSVYSGAAGYGTLADTSFSPNWGQATQYASVDVVGNPTLRYSNLNYQGIQLGSVLDITSYDSVHVDIYGAGTSAVNFVVINQEGGAGSTDVKREALTAITLNPGWNSVVIPVASLTSITPGFELNRVGQLMFTGSGTIYVDNIYFSKAVPTAVAPTVSNTSFCKGFGIALTATPSGNNELKWYTVATKGTALASAPIPTVTKTYYVAQVMSNGVISDRAAITATMNALPTTPSKLELTQGATVIKKVGNFIATETPLTLTATAAGTVATDHYIWTLGDVNQTDGGSTGIITVNFNAVPKGNTAIDLLVKSVSAAGCVSTTAKKLTVTRSEAGTPKGLVLTDATLADANAIPPVLPIVLKKLDSYTGSLKSRTLTLTATPNVTAGSQAAKYKWVLPAAAAIVNNSATAVNGETDTYLSDSNVISINLSGVTNETSFLFKVFGVNNNGTSLLSKDLTCTSAAPKTPGTITLVGGGVPKFNPTCATSTTITVQVPSVLGVTYTWTVAGSTDRIVGAQGNWVDINVEGVTTPKLLISVIASNGTGSSIAKTLDISKITTCVGGRIAPEAASATEAFSAVAYPNPSSTEGFRVRSSNGKSFGVQVYDMLGRSIEQRQMSSDAQIGSNYAKGIYNVIVNQGANVKTLRVIKQ